MSLAKKRWSQSVVVAIACVGVAVTPAPAGDGDADFPAFISKNSSPLVTVKFVLRVGGTVDREREEEITGVMIDPKGLVLCANTQLGGFASLWARWSGPGGGGVSVTPTELKVLVGDDTEGVAAEFIARDTELDLAWVRIKAPSDKPFDYVDFSKGVTPKIGQRVVAVQRMGKYFARAPVAGEGRIGGITTKPRDLYVLSGLAGGLGMPIYTVDGKILGVTVMQMPDPEELEGDLGGLSGSLGGLILPAAQVVKATARALEAADTE